MLLLLTASLLRRVLDELTPDEPEVLGLVVALVEPVLVVGRLLELTFELPDVPGLPVEELLMPLLDEEPLLLPVVPAVAEL